MTRDLQPVTKQFLTYNSKVDPSNSDQRILVKGSKNVLISDIEKVATIDGYTLFGTAGTGTAVTGSTEWGNSTGDDFSLRAHDAVLEVLINGVYETLMESLTSVALIFSPYWDNTEKIDRLLWSDGSANLHDWSGATATLQSITATTLTLQGTQTFAQHRFILNGTRAIRIKDDNGTWHRASYTGGESTTTLTGLDGDLTAFPFSAGSLIVQEVITRTNIISSTYNVDSVKVIENQVIVLSRTSNAVYISKNTSVTDYSFSTPRAPGEGAQLNLDGPGRAVGVLKGDIILFAGKGYIYKSVFNQITVGASLAETLKVERLKTTDRQSVLHQNLLADVGNGLAWIGHDNVLYQLLDATIAYNPDLKPLSDPMKPDFDATDFTGGHMMVIKNRLLISAPASSVNYIYEYRLNDRLEKIYFWQPPVTVYPVNRWAIINDLVYGHSSATSETYQLFTGTNANGKAIHNIALLARWNGGVRDELKIADEFFNEGAITGNTKISVTYFFDEDGGEYQSPVKIIDGSYPDILYSRAQDPSLGNNPDGDVSLEGDVTDEDSIQHFRIIDDLNETEFFDYGIMLETNDIDYRWEWMATGSNARLSENKPTGIKNNN